MSSRTRSIMVGALIVNLGAALAAGPLGTLALYLWAISLVVALWPIGLNLFQLITRPTALDIGLSAAAIAIVSFSGLVIVGVVRF